jgi:hypothetical protein
MSRRPLAGHRVLVVGRDFFEAIGVAKSLQVAGAQVMGPILGIDDALAQIRHDGFEIAAIDNDLPDDAAAQIAGALIDVNVPFVFADKPFESDALIETLANELNDRRS